MLRTKHESFAKALAHLLSHLSGSNIKVLSMFIVAVLNATSGNDSICAVSEAGSHASHCLDFSMPGNMLFVERQTCCAELRNFIVMICSDLAWIWAMLILAAAGVARDFEFL